MSVVRRDGLYCQFLERDLKTPLPGELNLKDSGKIYALAERGNYSMNFEGVTRSLAVDEQFYFAWPPAIRNLQRGTLIRILLGVLTVKPLLRVLISPHLQTYWEAEHLGAVIRQKSEIGGKE